MERAAALLSKLDIVAIVALQIISFVLGAISGGATAFATLLMLDKSDKIQLCIGLSMLGGIISAVFVSSLLLMDYLGFLAISSGGAVVVGSIASGALSVLIMMGLHRVSGFKAKYHGVEVELDIKEEKKDAKL